MTQLVFLSACLLMVAALIGAIVAAMGTVMFIWDVYQVLS